MQDVNACDRLLHSESWCAGADALHMRIDVE